MDHLVPRLTPNKRCKRKVGRFVDEQVGQHISLLSRLEELNRIALWIFQLDLLAARADLHLIAKMNPCLLQLLNSAR